MMKTICFGLAKYASDEYLKREDLSRWEIWMGRYILLVSLGFLAMLLFDLPLVALLVLLAMASVVVLINLVYSMFLFVMNGDPFWIALWYVLKYTGVFWLYWKLIFEKQVQVETSELEEFKEEDRFTHRGKDWVWLATGPPKYKHAIVMVVQGQGAFLPEPVPVVAGEDDSCST